MSNVRHLERWVTCSRNDAYEVSSLGQVRRRDSKRVLVAAPDGDGYPKLHLGRKCQVRVHQLVCEAFNGPRPSAGHVVDHIDFDRANNAPSNLRWVPEDENRWRWDPNGWIDTHERPDDEGLAELERDMAGTLEVIAAAGWDEVRWA